MPLDIKVPGYYEIIPDLVSEIAAHGDRPGAIATGLQCGIAAASL